MSTVSQPSDSLALFKVSLFSFFALIGVAVLTLIGTAGLANQPTALVFPSHWSPGSAMSAASRLNADILGTGRRATVIIISPHETLAFGKLLESGALFAVAGHAGANCRFPSS